MAQMTQTALFTSDQYLRVKTSTKYGRLHMKVERVWFVAPSPMITTMPVNLVSLDCASCGLKSLPPMPASLKFLNVSNNDLESLSALGPGLVDLVDLVELRCSGNRIRDLGQIPDSVRELYMSNNLVAELHTLPASLVKLNCSDNLLTEIAEFPTSLEYLNCANNRLTALPEFPRSVRVVIVDGNALNRIPPILVNHENPGARAILSAGGNALREFPRIYKPVGNVYFSAVVCGREFLVGADQGYSDELRRLQELTRVYLVRGLRAAGVPVELIMILVVVFLGIASDQVADVHPVTA